MHCYWWDSFGDFGILELAQITEILQQQQQKAKFCLGDVLFFNSWLYFNIFLFLFDVRFPKYNNMTSVL